jgi:hypothetical protein
VPHETADVVVHTSPAADEPGLDDADKGKGPVAEMPLAIEETAALEAEESAARTDRNTPQADVPDQSETPTASEDRDDAAAALGKEDSLVAESEAQSERDQGSPEPVEKPPAARDDELSTKAAPAPLAAAEDSEPLPVPSSEPETGLMVTESETGKPLIATEAHGEPAPRVEPPKESDLTEAANAQEAVAPSESAEQELTQIAETPAAPGSASADHGEGS